MEDLDWLGSLRVVTNTRAEEGEHLAPRPVGKRIQQTHIISVVERHPPLLTVEVHADPLRRRAQLQPRPGLGAS